MKKYMCSECGSEEVCNLRLVNLNTNKVYDIEVAISTPWCLDCTKEVSIVEIEIEDPSIIDKWNIL
jgi:DNA-directed RNA polymerase subunit RPC12/RpoP